MSTCLFLQHDPAFGPGRAVPIFRDFGIPSRIVRLDQGEPVPRDFDEVRMLVLLGGPQRLVEGAAAHERAAFLQREIEVIRPLIREDFPVLGFGLGAQILAKAAGANISPNTKSADGEPSQPAPFYGWSRLSLPFPGGTDPVLFGLHDGTPMFFWHKDIFDLPRLPPPPGYDASKPGAMPSPAGSVLLASAPHCKNAAFRFKDRMYGFAFHPELDRDDIEAVLARHGDAAGAAFGAGEVERIHSAGARWHADNERLCARLLGNYVQFFKAYNPAGVKT